MNVPEDSDFTIYNIPFGGKLIDEKEKALTGKSCVPPCLAVFRPTASDKPRVATAIGNYVSGGSIVRKDKKHIQFYFFFFFSRVGGITQVVDLSVLAREGLFSPEYAETFHEVSRKEMLDPRRRVKII